MSCKFLYKNYIDKKYFPDYSLTAQDVYNSTFPVSNIYDPLLTIVWRSGTLDTRIYLDTDASGIQPTHCILNKHNLTANATVTIEASAINDFINPDYNFEATICEDKICAELDELTAYRYWSIHIVDAGNADDYIEIGHAFLGDELEIGCGFSNSFQINPVEQSQHIISATGSVFSNTIGLPYDVYELNVPWVTNAEKKALLKTMYDEYVRNTQPFYAYLTEPLLDEDDFVYCVFESKPATTHIITRQVAGVLTGRFYAMKLKLKQAR